MVIPGPRKLCEGDIVSVDVGAYIDGYHGDSCKTFAVGKISPEAEALMKSTEESLYLAIDMVKPGVDLATWVRRFRNTMRTTATPL